MDRLLSLPLALLGIVLGVRLLVLARRPREVPELLLGFFFLCGAPAVWLRLTVQYRPLESDYLRALAVLSSLGTSIAAMVLYIFTYRTFRSRVRWARVLTLIGIVALTAGLGIDVHAVLLLGHVELRLSIALPRLVCLSWTACESTRCYLMMRRRSRFKLADPVVANRFLLYALWTGALATVPGWLATVELLALAHADINWQRTFTILGVASGAIALIAVYLNFWPPQPYLRWIRAQHEGDPQ
jgi:hypothetical protein